MCRTVLHGRVLLDRVEAYVSITFRTMSAWQVVSGLVSADTRTIVGGYWSPRSQDDWSRLERAADVKQEKKARVSIHFIAARTDSLKTSYDLCMLPVAPESKTKSNLQLHVSGQIMAAAIARQNKGLPALGFAFDGGSTNAALSKALLGVLDPEVMAQAPFWCECRTESMDLQLVPFRFLYWNDHLLLGCQDCLHLLKRLAAHRQTGRLPPCLPKFWICMICLCFDMVAGNYKRYLSHLIEIHIPCPEGAKCIEWGSTTVDLSGMLQRGMPLKAYVGTDGMSDVEGLMRQNSRFLTVRTSTAWSAR